MYTLSADYWWKSGFFHMVDYLRDKMSVSILLYPKGKKREDVEELEKIWHNVNFLSLLSK